MKRVSFLPCRQILAVALAILLGLTNVAMALGQMNASATGERILCVGNGYITVQVDDEGQPPKSKTVCPECISIVAFSGLQSPDVPFSVGELGNAEFSETPPNIVCSFDVLIPPARAPPLV